MLPHCVFVVGTTGVGKSQLAIELAKSFGGAVINADSMQVYKGLDILTNKVSREEMQGVPHALLGFLEPGQEYFVGDFVKDAQREINRCHSDGKLPIVAGGTAYYAQNLLFEGGLSSSDDKAELLADPLCRLKQNELLASRLQQLPPELVELLRVTLTLPNTPSPFVLPPDFPYKLLPSSLRSPEKVASAFYELLDALDPEMASRWHARDIRKVRRNVEICLEQGRRASEVIAGQEVIKARYRALVIWLRADQVSLDERLEKRVDKMMDDGMLDEVRRLYNLRELAGLPQDATSGIFQAIGYRELLGYLRPPCICSPASSHPQLLSHAERMEHAVERTKLSTRQYAKKQLQWLQKRLLPACVHSEDVEIVTLDASDPNKWEVSVRDPAIARVGEWLRGEKMPSLPPDVLALLNDGADETSTTFITCETCSSVTGELVRLPPQQMDAHLLSKAHRYRAKPRQSR